MAWIRLGKVVYSYSAVKTKPNDKITGHGDVMRLVCAYTALCARALTHAGINNDDIAEFKMVIKEFLSTVNELDIQVRFKKVSKKEPNNEIPSS